ncbi:nucleolysin TIA-1 [Thecamonas trahens ATCC 50062]|uniref:Nucleolysin TIA-1 n=1 Tax=Thecamonas trahens ATCC 50062 TaxID=461836 RepID=A0A0L0DCE6_THETB|nr:nucleolysin TIA-1 [Thecamonas trahens ATCC 50062]KNC49761.1 nucleolysin TIA-1 [Thecamonas trahens ATCC 50062]|eukprot:XP_013757546.1 nucleolysin TIA-1 [Thecamonas trahens ATCC 50062]
MPPPVASRAYGPAERTLYVGSLDLRVTREELEQVALDALAEAEEALASEFGGGGGSSSSKRGLSSEPSGRAGRKGGSRTGSSGRGGRKSRGSRRSSSQSGGRASSSLGTVVSAKIILDAETHGSAGYGFVEFETREGAQAAMPILQGRRVRALRIRINWAVQGSRRVADEDGLHSLFVGDLCKSVDDDMLHDAFAHFSSLTSARVMWDVRTGTSREFGFVSFRDASDAERALKTMGGTMLGRRPIRVNRANKKTHSKNTAVGTAAVMVERAPSTGTGVKVPTGSRDGTLVMYTDGDFGRLSALGRGSCELFLSKLKSKMSVGEFEAALAKHGVIETIVYNRKKGTCRVTFESHHQAVSAIIGLHGWAPAGCPPLQVAWSNSGRSRSLQRTASAPMGPASGRFGERGRSGDSADASRCAGLTDTRPPSYLAPSASMAFDAYSGLGSGHGSGEVRDLYAPRRGSSRRSPLSGGSSTSHQSSASISPDAMAYAPPPGFVSAGGSAPSMAAPGFGGYGPPPGMGGAAGVAPGSNGFVYPGYPMPFAAPGLGGFVPGMSDAIAGRDPWASPMFANSTGLSGSGIATGRNGRPLSYPPRANQSEPSSPTGVVAPPLGRC